MLDFTTLLITSTREFPTLKSEKGTPLTGEAFPYRALLNEALPQPPPRGCVRSFL